MILHQEKKYFKSPFLGNGDDQENTKTKKQVKIFQQLCASNSDGIKGQNNFS
jgi:hypothetical protein